MKATYLKPTTEEFILSSSVIMIGASDGNGNKLVEDGGGTSEGGISEGDARRHRSVWDDGMEEEEEQW